MAERTCLRYCSGEVPHRRWNHSWVNRRIKLIPHALDAYAAAFPHGDQFQWNIDPQYRPAEYASATQDLRIAHQTDVQGSYCSATSSASN